MDQGNEHIKLSHWINTLLARGKNSFTLAEVKKSFPALSESAVKSSLNRLSAKGNVLSVLKGYYLIISPQYASRGVLPPVLFIDGLMTSLQRPYYIGLLNAASFYGAAHQQPQEFYVFTTLPALRVTKKKNIKINYISKKELPVSLLEKRKSETGYITISSPELTAADLVQFEKRIGGLNRVATVLNELADAMSPRRLNNDFLHQVPVASIQRLGYLLEKVLNKQNLAAHLFKQSQMAGLRFYRIPLKLNAATKGVPADDKWKVIINSDIEIDE